MGLKSIFDGLYVDQLIRKDERGAFVIYPHGLLGRGYVLPAEKEPAVRQRLRTVMLGSIIVSVAFAMFISRVIAPTNDVGALGWGIIAALGAILLAGIITFQRRLAVGLEPVPGPRPSLREWMRRGRQSRPIWTYWFCVVCGALLGLISAAAIGVGIADGDALVIGSSVFLLLVSALAAWDGVRGLSERRGA